MNGRFSTYAQTCFLLKNNQNEQQNKLVNMVIGHIHIWPMFSEPRYVYAFKCILFIYINTTLVFNERILQPFMRISLVSLG